MEKIQSLLGRIVMGEKITIPFQYVPNIYELMGISHKICVSGDMTLAISSCNGIFLGYSFPETGVFNVVSIQCFMNIIKRSIEKGWEIPSNDDKTVDDKTIDIISQLI